MDSVHGGNQAQASDTEQCKDREEKEQGVNDVDDAGYQHTGLRFHRQALLYEYKILYHFKVNYAIIW